MNEIPKMLNEAYEDFGISKKIIYIRPPRQNMLFIHNWHLHLSQPLTKILDSIPVYDDIWHRLGHDTEESTITLLKDIANIEKRAYESRLPNITDAHQSQALRRVISAIDNYDSSLDSLVQRLDLRRNYINNVRNYSQFVRSRYEYHQNSIMAISTQPDMSFLTTLSCMVNLYPCLYRMESVSRYPLSEFAYDNLNLLTNLGQSCQSLIEMLQDLITLISSDLR